MASTDLDAKMILRLLREEYLMKPGESDSFTLNIDGARWEMKLKRESEVYLPFKYSLAGKCTEPTAAGIHATVNRRFTTIDGALLHCLNHFNENANLRNKYNSIEDAIYIKVSPPLLRLTPPDGKMYLRREKGRQKRNKQVKTI